MLIVSNSVSKIELKTLSKMHFPPNLSWHKKRLQNAHPRQTAPRYTDFLMMDNRIF